MSRTWAWTLLALSACTASATPDDGGADTGSEATSADASTTTAVATTEATTDASGGSTGDPSGGPTSSSGTADATTSDTGEPCEIADPAEIHEIDGCPAPVGEPSCSEGQQHVPQDTDVPWQADPPHSGPHYPTWEAWGEHDTVVPRGNWVHNLEHGGIVLTYRCNDDCPEELAVLREVVAMRPDLRILLTKDPLLPGERFAAISWTWVLRTDAPDLATLLCFADQHENRAPEDVP